jgi:casein kinase 1
MPWMDGIPNIYGLYDYDKSRRLVMDQLRASLENLFKRFDKQFSLKTVLMIGAQMLRIIK